MLKTSLFKHQSDEVENLIHRNYWALLFDPGTGKTLTMIALVDRLKPLKVLVVCPNTIVENWAEEIAKHSDLTSVCLSGSKERRIKLMQKPADFHIINYESTRVLKDQLCKNNYDMIILDESQCVKTHNAQQTKACNLLAVSISRRYILTGTLIMNNPLDVFGQYRCLNPLVFGNNFYKFRSRYAVMGGFDNRIVTRWINMAEFKQRVFSCATRITKDECLDLPDKLYQVVRLDLPEEQKKVYDALKKDFLAEFDMGIITAPVMLTRLIRFSQITAGFTKDVEGTVHRFKVNPKINWLLDFIKEYDEKVVVFCRFLSEIATLGKALAEEGIPYTEIYGEVTDRMDRINAFNKDENIKVFIGQIQTSGIGINLTSSHYTVFFSNSYSYGQRLQCEDRIHRIGQTKNVTYIDLLMRGTIDEGVHKALDKKESLSNMVISQLAEVV